MFGAPNSAASMTKLAPGRPPKEVLLWPWLLWILPLLPPLCLDDHQMERCWRAIEAALD